MLCHTQLSELATEFDVFIRVCVYSRQGRQRFTPRFIEEGSPSDRTWKETAFPDMMNWLAIVIGAIAGDSCLVAKDC